MQTISIPKLPPHAPRHRQQIENHVERAQPQRERNARRNVRRLLGVRLPDPLEQKVRRRRANRSGAGLAAHRARVEDRRVEQRARVLGVHALAVVLQPRREALEGAVGEFGLIWLSLVYTGLVILPNGSTGQD